MQLVKLAGTPYLFCTEDALRNQGTNIEISTRYLRPTNSVDPTAKSVQWMDMKLALAEARVHDMDGAVPTDAERSLASGANIFLIKGDQLHTPVNNCLRG